MGVESRKTPHTGKDLYRQANAPPTTSLRSATSPSEEDCSAKRRPAASTIPRASILATPDAPQGRSGDQSQPESPLFVTLVPGSSLRSVRENI